MTIDDAQKELKELTGVNVEILKEPLFLGYDISFSYPYYFNEEKRYHIKHIHEACPDGNWGEWIEENREKINKLLSII
jgi:hypothetical protein